MSRGDDQQPKLLGRDEANFLFLGDEAQPGVYLVVN
jgi:hypothetical protein